MATRKVTFLHPFVLTAVGWQGTARVRLFEDYVVYHDIVLVLCAGHIVLNHMQLELAVTW